MSVHATSWAWRVPLDALSDLASEDKVAPSVARLVLVKLGDNANDDGDAWPRVETISTETELGERTVQRALRALASIGCVQAFPRPRRSTVYRLNLMGAVAAPIPVADGCRSRQSGVPLTTETGAAPAPRTTNEPSGNTGLAAARPPDLMFERFERELGKVQTKSERGRRNRALAELRQADVDDQELERLIGTYRRSWPQVALTASAIAANLATLRDLGGHRSGPFVRPEVCPDCQVGGGAHSSECEQLPTAPALELVRDRPVGELKQLKELIGRIEVRT